MTDNKASAESAELRIAKAGAVRNMFDTIAGSYDFLNHFLSVGIDIIWRKRAVEKLGDLADKKILDLACGTCDLAIAIAEKSPDVKVVGADFSKEMIEIGRRKIVKKGLSKQIEAGEGDALNLRFDDESFDAVTCAFGVRNFADLDRGLSEMSRILKPGGKMIILEFTKPDNFIFSYLYKIYFTKILPLLGKMVSGSSSAYDYLPDSVYKFPTPAELAEKMQNAGIKETAWYMQTFGICAIHTGIKK